MHFLIDLGNDNLQVGDGYSYRNHTFFKPKNDFVVENKAKEDSKTSFQITTAANEQLFPAKSLYYNCERANNILKLYEIAAENGYRIESFENDLTENVTSRVPNYTDYPPNVDFYVKSIVTGFSLMFASEALDIDETDICEKEFSEDENETKCFFTINFGEIREASIREMVQNYSNLRRNTPDKKTSWPEWVIRGTDLPVSLKETKLLVNYLKIFVDILEKRLNSNGYADPDTTTPAGIDLSYEDLHFKVLDLAEEVMKLHGAVNVKIGDRLTDILNTFKSFYNHFLKFSIESDAMRIQHFLPTNHAVMSTALKNYLSDMSTWKYPEVYNNHCYMKYEETDEELAAKYPEGVIVSDTEHAERLHKLTGEPYFAQFKLFLRRDVDEPYLLFNQKTFKTGFVTIKEPKRDAEAKTCIFEADCFEQCAADLRLWVCDRCWTFMNSTTNAWVVSCECGSARINNLQFRCSNAVHRPPARNRVILEMIITQLQKRVQLNNEQGMQGYVDKLNSNSNNAVQKALMALLKNGAVDGDTKNLITKYLS